MLNNTFCIDKETIKGLKTKNDKMKLIIDQLQKKCESAV